MKKKKGLDYFLILVLILSLCGCGKGKQEVSQIQEEESQDDESGNLIRNGSFDSNIDGYYTYTEGGSGSIKLNSDKELQCDITSIGKVAHGVQIYVDGFKLRQGVEYEFSFDVHGTIEREFDWRFQYNGGDYHAYVERQAKVSSAVNHVCERFVMEEETDAMPRLCFNVGLTDTWAATGVDASSVGEHSLMFDNISLIVVDDSNAVGGEVVEEVLSKVRINQIGYRTLDPKYAVFADLEDGDNTFTVINVDTNEKVYDGEMSLAYNVASTGEVNCTGDFSSLNTPGTYKIVTGKGEESYPFVIADDVYQAVFKDLVRMLYLQRCGMELTQDLAGDFSHSACHNDLATVYGTSNKIDVSGGWHDAGDYGRYVVSGVKTLADIFIAYQANPSIFSDEMNIPESGNGIPDILDEAKYEMDWLFKMQDEVSGGVYHKVAGEKFPGTVMPQEETWELFAFPISNTATGDFAAIMAMGYDVYKTIDIEYANKCLEASKKAYAYLVEHVDDFGFKNPENVETGEYPDSECYDELMWASAELYKVTDDNSYVKEIGAARKKLTGVTGLGWADVSGYATYSALTNEKLASCDGTLVEELKKTFFEQVVWILAPAKNNYYGINRNTSFEWGSNMGIADDGIILMMANNISKNEEYVNYAKADLYYLFGTNAIDYCFVTGYGTKSPEHTHHRPSQSLTKTMTGMLVGGVNSNLDDPYAKAVLTGKAPAKCYTDSEQSYSCNEICVYWNSPLICLLAMIE